VNGGHKQQNGDDGAHRRLNHTGPKWQGSGPVPEVRPSQRQIENISATRFNNSYDAITNEGMAF
jgi:hypothetical protein